MSPTSSRWRWLALGVVVVVAVAGTTVAVLRGRARAEQSSTGNLPAPSRGTVPVPSLDDHPHLLFRGTALDRTYGRVKLAPLAPDDAPVAVTDLTCDRVDFRRDRGVCLVRSLEGMVTKTQAIVFDRRFRPLKTVDLAGYPSRTRVSPDGRWGSTTTFVSGDSYATMGQFSVRTDILDLRTGEISFDLEKLTVRRDGEVIHDIDFNFWGVTFAADSRTFYATLGTGGRTYLLKGDRVSREATVIHPDVECPSLSPDNTRIAFKKRVSAAGEETRWRLSVLDLATMVEHPLAEQGNVDDQAGWADDHTVIYGLVSDLQAEATIRRDHPGISPLLSGAGLETDTWSVPADGGGAPRRLRSGAWSTSVTQPGA